MAECLAEHLGSLPQVILDADIVDAHAKSERVDKHSHRVGNPQVASAAAHRTEIHLTVVCIARHHIGRRGQEEMRWCNLVLPAESAGFVEVSLAHGLANESLLIAVLKVGGNLTGSLTGLQLLGEEPLGGGECLRLLSFLLVVHKVQISVFLFLNGLSFHHGAYLPDEEVGRASVEQQMVDVHQEVCASLGLDYLEAVQRSLLQVEGLHELVLIGIQFLLAHGGDRHLHGYTFVGCLYDGVALGREVDAQFGMALRNGLHGVSQLLGIGSFRIGQQVRNIIDGRGGILQAVEIHASLRIRKGHARLFLCLRRLLLLLRSASQHRLQNLVLNRLQRAGLHQRPGVQYYSVPLVHLHGQFDGRDGGQAGIA